MPAGIKILTSPIDFTSDEIGLIYLKHYIENSDAGPNADWKLMLMNNYGSHIIFEFALLADENHIRSYPLILHLTHCMQSLDVAVFQSYKHWHNDAIQQVMAEFNLEYFMVRFCEDLTKIRNNTFKKSTIQSAFEKSGMYSLDSANCISLLRKFVPGTVQKKSRKDELSLSSSTTASFLESELPRIRSQTLHKVEVGLNEWRTKIEAFHVQWSDLA